LAAATENTIIIPGHGKPVSNKAELKEFRDMLVDVRDKVAALKKAGRTIEETVAAKPTAAHDAKWHGHDMDHYAADAAAVTEHLDLRNAVHIGHSTGGGEVTRHVARHGKGRVAKAVLMSAVPRIMVKSPNNPDGMPISFFDGLRKSLAANRAQFYRDFASTVFYGFNRPGAKSMDGVIGNWWRQGMIGGAKAHYDGIKGVL
jgi:pimeloyl-ACP methyl ester carboxylesterase